MQQSMAGRIELTIDVARISHHHRVQLQLVQRARHPLQLEEGEREGQRGEALIVRLLLNQASRVEVDLLFLAHLIFKTACRRERDDCERS